MRILLVFVLIISAINAENIDCTALFEARKDEIKNELLKIDEQRQALEAYRASLINLNEQNSKILEKKKQSFEQMAHQKELDLNATLEKISQKEQKISQMLAQNEKILKELKSMTNDKVSETYAKMKDQVAADVLTQMGAKKAAAIIYTLSPKKIAAVLAKMESSFASDLTLLLQIGPPFDKKTDQNLSLDNNQSAPNLGAQAQ